MVLVAQVKILLPTNALTFCYDIVESIDDYVENIFLNKFLLSNGWKKIKRVSIRKQ
jgi:hypothetical protein